MGVGSLRGYGFEPSGLAKQKYLTKQCLPKCARPAHKRARMMRRLLFEPSADEAIAKRERAMMWEDGTRPLKLELMARVL